VCVCVSMCVCVCVCVCLCINIYRERERGREGERAHTRLHFSVTTERLSELIKSLAPYLALDIARIRSLLRAWLHISPSISREFAAY
jgi:hypothetical protein